MVEMTVGIRDLKSQLSEYLRRVKAGQTIRIAGHDKPTSRIAPKVDTVGRRSGA